MQGNWLQMGSGCLCPSPLFSADQFVVSVPTEISGSFNTMKTFWEGREDGDG